MKKASIFDVRNKIAEGNTESGEEFLRRVRRSKREARALKVRRGKSA